MFSNWNSPHGAVFAARYRFVRFYTGLHFSYDALNSYILTKLTEEFVGN